MARKTSCIVSFGSNAIAIREDAAYAIVQGGLQSFADMDDLNTGTVAAKPYATYEPNYWLLDGNYKFVPDANARGGYISTAMSGSGSPFNFGSPVPEISITFDNIYSTDGLTLRFSDSGDYADSMQIGFYNSVGGLITSDAYTPSSTEFSTGLAVADFKRIDLFFNSTNRAQRYARLLRIDFDALTRFEGADIKAARVVEEINPLSLELPINTLELDLFSTDGDFSIVAPAGFYANLQYKEPLDVHEEINGAVIYIGRFYLDKWESLSENEAKFEASDAIGLLDKPVFLGGLYASPDIDSEVLIDDILTTAGLAYDLDALLNGFPIDGFIEPYSTCRSALQQVLFYIGGYATCSRSNVIQIRPLELASDLVATFDHTLTQAEKGISSPLTLRPLVTGVELHKYEYFSDNAATGEELYNDTFGTGNHQLILGSGSKMPAGLVLGGTAAYTITLFRYTYVEINVTGAGTVILTQNEGITVLEVIEGVYNLSLPANAQLNVLTISDAPIITTSALGGQILASEVAQRVYDYFTQRYLQKTKLFGSLLAPGDSVLVDVQSSRQLAGIVERMETDLAGGYVSNVDIVGVVI